jgi:hypothetical protein
MSVEEFYEHTTLPVADAKEFMQNIDLKVLNLFLSCVTSINNFILLQKVQRLVRQAEEIKEVNSQLKRQEKEDNIYMILRGSTLV